jgi:hypothetical protein
MECYHRARNISQLYPVLIHISLVAEISDPLLLLKLWV